MTTIWILRVNLFWAQTTDSIPLAIDRTSIWTQFHTICIQDFVWRLFISHLFSFRLSCVHGAASFKSLFIHWDWELQENEHLLNEKNILFYNRDILFQQNIYFLILEWVYNVWMFQLTIHVSFTTHGSRFSHFDIERHRLFELCIQISVAWIHSFYEWVWINRFLKQFNQWVRIDYFTFWSIANSE